MSCLLDFTNQMLSTSQEPAIKETKRGRNLQKGVVLVGSGGLVMVGSGGFWWLSLALLGFSWAFLSCFGLSCGSLGLSWAVLGFLESSWGCLGLSGGLLGLSWALLAFS